MASKSKIQKQANNILYLQDADAKALGIIEGSAQRVFIDNREVEVVFVDEHEVIPVSQDEKRIYQEAYKLASKYADETTNQESPASKALVAKGGKTYRSSENRNKKSFKEMFNDSWTSFTSKFKKEPRVDVSNYSSESNLVNENGVKTSMVKYNAKANCERNAQYDQRRHAKHSIRNDVFTKEELEIIQNVIDKSKNAPIKETTKVKTFKK